MSMKQVQVLEATKAAPNSNGRRTAGIQIERIRVIIMLMKKQRNQFLNP